MKGCERQSVEKVETDLFQLGSGPGLWISS